MALSLPTTADAMAAPARRPDGVALALGGMLALASAMGIGRFVYTPILPPMAEALRLSKADAGLIASANFAGYLAGALMTALPRLPGSRRGWFLGALALGAGTTAAMALVGSLAAFMLLRFLGGAASAFVLVLSASVVVERLSAAGRSGLAGLHFGGVGIGIAVSALLVDGLEALVAWLVPAAPPVHAAPPKAAGPQAKAARGLGWLCLSYGLFGVGYVVTATFLVVAVRTAPGARLLEPVVWLVVGLAMIPSPVIWVRLGARWGLLRAYAAACLLEAVGVAAGGVWPGAGGALLASVLLGGTIMGITALLAGTARALWPDQHRRVFALMTAGFGVGQIAGPLGAGWLMDRTHGFVLPSLLAAAALAGAAVVATRVAEPGSPQR